MTETNKIYFDPTRRGFEGVFPSRNTLINSLVNADPADPAYLTFVDTVGLHPVSAVAGFIGTTAYNKDLKQRRLNTLKSQLQHLAGEIPETGLNFQIPPDLLTAFDKAALNHNASTPFKMAVLSNTRENLFFNLALDYPSLNLHAVCAAPTVEYAQDFNTLIQDYAPKVDDKISSLSQRLLYDTAWHEQTYDLVHVNAALFYEDEEGVKTTIKKIKGTGARQVVFNNLIVTQDADDKVEWTGQRYSGGIVPLRRAPRSELITLMQAAGYRLIDNTGASVTYDVKKDSPILKQLGEQQNLSFELAS